MIMSKPKTVADAIRTVGTEAYASIKALPESKQSMGWACVAAAIVGAAINSSREPDKVVEMVEQVIQTLTITKVWNQESKE
jgi:hypothetical protein